MMVALGRIAFPPFLVVIDGASIEWLAMSPQLIKPMVHIHCVRSFKQNFFILLKTPTREVRASNPSNGSIHTSENVNFRMKMPAYVWGSQVAYRGQRSQCFRVGRVA